MQEAGEESSTLEALQQRVAELEGRRSALEGMVELSPVALASFDTDLRCCHANSAFADLYGTSMTDLRGSKLSTLAHPSASFLEAQLTRFLKTEQASSSAEPIEEPSTGSPRLLHRFLPRRDDHGQLVAVSCRIEVAPDRGVGRVELAELLDLLPHGVQVNDTRGVVTYSNKAHARIHGRAEGELEGSHIWDLVEEEHKEELRAYFAYLVAEQPPATPYESTGRRPDGSRFYQRVDWDYQRDSSGRLIGFVSIVTDTSKETELQRELTRSEQGLREAQELAKIGSWEWDPRVPCTRWSKEMYKIYGLESDSFEPSCDESFLDPIHSDDRQRVLDAVQRALRSAEPFSVEHRVRRADGDLVYVHTLGRVETDSEGRATRLVGTSQDTSKLREAESHKQRLRELDHRVKNNLATILALAQLTAKSSDSLHTFLDIYSARIQTMSMIHEALANQAWTTFCFATFLRSTLLPFGDKVILSGPAIELPARAAVPLGLALHEFSTNAAKHGGLEKNGRIEVVWSRSESDMLVISWSEFGERLDLDSTTDGTGLTMVRALVEGELDGHLHLDYSPEGARHELRIPIASP